jgi:hypothetical protein
MVFGERPFPEMINANALSFPKNLQLKSFSGARSQDSKSFAQNLPLHNDFVSVSCWSLLLYTGISVHDWGHTLLKQFHFLSTRIIPNSTE